MKQKRARNQIYDNPQGQIEAAHINLPKSSAAGQELLSPSRKAWVKLQSMPSPSGATHLLLAAKFLDAKFSRLTPTPDARVQPFSVTKVPDCIQLSVAVRL